MAFDKSPVLNRPVCDSTQWMAQSNVYIYTSFVPFCIRARDTRMQNRSLSRCSKVYVLLMTKNEDEEQQWVYLEDVEDNKITLWCLWKWEVAAVKKWFSGFWNYVNPQLISLKAPHSTDGRTCVWAVLCGLYDSWPVALDPKWAKDKLYLGVLGMIKLTINLVLV